MYNILLHSHSGLRWIVLILLITAVAKAWTAGDKKFGSSDKKLVKFTVIFTHLQLVIGLCLYFISPLMNAFMHSFPDSMKDQTLRYFGLEHSLMMIIATVLITIGSARSKKTEDDASKFKIIKIWFTIALAIIFLMIPWSFFIFNPDRPMF